MTENMAARGEGLAGRTMAQIEMRNACFRDMLGLIKACHSDAPENSTGKEALTALYDSIQSQGVEGFGAALEAAAPAGTAHERELLQAVLNCETHHDERGHAYLKVPARSLNDLAAVIAAALATPSPQAPPDNQEGAGWTDAATQEQPAGSRDGIRRRLQEFAGRLHRPGCPLRLALSDDFVKGWDAAKAHCAERIESILRNYPDSGSPRKVGEDGAQTFEQWWQAEGVHMVRTTHRTGYELMKEAWNAARSSSVPVGEQK